AGAWVYLANAYVAAAAAVASEIVDPAAVVGVEQAVRGATGVDEAMATPPGRPLGLKEGHGLDEDRRQLLTQFLVVAHQRSGGQQPPAIMMAGAMTGS
ncbi:MAG TPA: hypothetical protein VE219_02915, partial [Candidatus Sulfotelmatobacter sp.]|nr:hypothetical protein [Candidatus Sulfotelmatobacter sp.]